MWLLYLTSLVMLVLALRGVRWAYVALAALILFYFPASVGFHLRPRACELLVPVPLALYSLHNYPHIVLFAGFYVVSWVQFRGLGWWGLARAGLATLVMGALLELAEGVSGNHNCRLRDLVPDAAGGMIAALSLVAWRALRQQITGATGSGAPAQ